MPLQESSGERDGAEDIRLVVAGEIGGASGGQVSGFALKWAAQAEVGEGGIIRIVKQQLGRLELSSQDGIVCPLAASRSGGYMLRCGWLGGSKCRGLNSQDEDDGGLILFQGGKGFFAFH